MSIHTSVFVDCYTYFVIYDPKLTMFKK